MSKISKEDFLVLKELGQTDPDFVKSYLASHIDDSGNVSIDQKQTSIENSTKKEAELKTTDYYTMSEAAEKLGCCENTIKNHILSGEIAALRETEGRRRWLVAKKDIEKLAKNATIKQYNYKKKARQNVSQTSDKSPTTSKLSVSNYIYENATSRNVLDFLSKWHLSRSFGAETLVEHFNQVSKIPTDFRQMLNILSNLYRNNAIERLGKGIYCDKNATHSSPVVPSVPKIELEQEQKEEVVHKKIHKSKERQAVEDYIERYAQDNEDFYFSIKKVIAENPKLDSRKIAKAIQNMASSNTDVVKASGEGNYCRVVSKKDSSTEVEEIQKTINELQNKLSKLSGR